MGETTKQMLANVKKALADAEVPAKTAKRLTRAIYEIGVAELEVGLEESKAALKAAKKA